MRAPGQPLITALFGLSLLGGAGCHAGYIVKAGYFQAELLHSREPIATVVASGTLKPEQLAALDIIADVKAFGEELGLKPTKNYGTIAAGWGRTIWNVSGCEPLAFEARTWWFPIVGRVPYLGFFRVEDADRVIQKLDGRGLDAYKRTAGAYSTLGWFKDPILPEMLGWDEFDLADTVLHELAHATVWVPGSVSFNESFASFVGEEAAFRYLAARHGPESEPVLKARHDFEDYETWRALQQALYVDLDAVYTDASLSDAEKAAKKAALFAGFPERVSGAPLHDPARYVAAAGRGTWNNARLIQFKTYNSKRASFEALLAAQGDDLLRFMDRVRDVTAGARDPYAAIEAAAGPS